MRRKIILAAGLLLSVSALSQLPTHFDGKTWWDLVKVLAADDMEGRETGSKGLEAAEAYVVAQLRQAGLQPAGSDGYYRPVKLQSLDRSSRRIQVLLSFVTARLSRSLLAKMLSSARASSSPPLKCRLLLCSSDTA